jgi:hypothetical protein
MTVHQIYEAIRSLPVPERLRLVERVVHDVAEAPAPGEGAPKPSLLGLFEDEPEVIDEICSEALRDRGVRRLRTDE